MGLGTVRSMILSNKESSHPITLTKRQVNCSILFHQTLSLQPCIRKELASINNSWCESRINDESGQKQLEHLLTVCINPLRLRLLLLRLFLVFFSSSTFSRSNPPCTHSLTLPTRARACERRAGGRARGRARAAMSFQRLKLQGSSSSSSSSSCGGAAGGVASRRRRRTRFPLEFSPPLSNNFTCFGTEH